MTADPWVLPAPAPVATAGARVTLTPASAITMRAARWLWAERIPAGALTLLAGREGIGKSLIAYEIAARITTGTLPGEHHGQPRAVLIVATEDSWAHTIVPRLTAAGADLGRVYRVDMTTSDEADSSLSLPRDLAELESAARTVAAALVLLDPLMSRLGASLDTHKDAEVRLALEPLTAIADRVGFALLGLIHVNKSNSTDPLTTIMGSRAFAAVARAVLFAVRDPDDPTTCLLGTEKSNLGRVDLPTLTYTITASTVGTDPDDGRPVTAAHLRWTGETERTVRDAAAGSAETGEDRSATKEAGDWLLDYLILEGGTASSADIKRDGLRAGHSQDALKRARTKVGVTVSTISRPGVPRSTVWNHSQCSPGETALTTPTALTALTGPVGAVGAVGADPPRGAPTTEPLLPGWAASGYDA